MESEQNESNGSWQQRENPFTSPTAVQIRLGNEKLLNDIIMYLTGIEERDVVVKQPDGRLTTIRQKVKVGERKANDIGVQSILAMISACINPSTVQGNYTEGLYFYDTDINMKKIETNLMINRIRWGIQQDDYPLLTMMLKDLFSKFATRLIGNKERESLMPTVVTHENITQTQQAPQNGFLGFGRSNNNGAN